jgi:hypothetical protein
LIDTILGRLTKNKIDDFIKYDIKTSTNLKNRSFPRISLRPFTKWYIKNYSINSDYTKIIKAIINKEPKDLNKNLKIKYKNIKISKKIKDELKKIL